MPFDWAGTPFLETYEPRGERQAAYVNWLSHESSANVVFGIGPAGVGKVRLGDRVRSALCRSQTGPDRTGSSVPPDRGPPDRTGPDQTGLTSWCMQR